MSNNRLLLRLLPILIAVVLVFFQWFSAERFVNEAGRSAKMGLSRGKEASLGLQAYQDVLRQSDVLASGPDVDMVHRCAERLAHATGDSGSTFKWEVTVVRSSQVNAFCLPGGKIVVYTGILPVARTETGLAVVMGHEMAHATLRHGSERMFQQQAANTILTGVSFTLGDMNYQQRRAVMGVLGAGAQYGVLNPFSRQHESEADAIGLKYMAKAGYDPREAITFWQRMSSASAGKAPAEILSTHPSDATRIKQLEDLLPQVLPLYNQAAKAPLLR